MPVAEANFRTSVLELIDAHATLPEDEEGYHMWLEAFQRGDAGVLTLDLTEIVGVMAEALAAPPPNVFEKNRFH